MIRCIAIDDEPLALQQMESYIGKIPYLELVAKCQNAEQAQEVINDDRIDAIFCDINMPELNGLDFVKSLAHPPMVVFTTAYSEYAVDGFKLDAVDYLTKAVVNDPTQWNMSSKKTDADDVSDRVQMKTSGDIANVDKNVKEKTKVATLRWYVTPGTAE